MSTNHMHPTNSDTTCQHPASELIEAVAFGFATDEEITEVQNHVAECPECAAALEDARFAAQALPLSVPERDVPESVWSGIEARIQPQAPASTVASSPVSTRSQFRIPWAIAAVLALITLAGGIFLGRTVFESDSSSPQQVDVAFVDPNSASTGSVRYISDEGVILLDMENLPPAPEGQVYQIWMIEGETPVSMGVMNPASTSFATSGNPAEYDVLAITLEPGPTGSQQPTSEPIAIAELAPLLGD